MIEATALTKNYRDLVAVEDISFGIEKGEVVGFLGPNGAGKTTTLRMLTGAMPPTRGSARIAGFDVLDEPLEVKKRIGYLPEVPPLYPELTVREYLRFVATLRGVAKKGLAAHVDQVIERTALVEVRKRLIGNLSKGFRQRVGLAQALLADPPVLILDEPTAGLDPRQIGEVRELIRQLAGDHTVLLSTHILQEVVAICERVIIVNRAHLVADDKLEAIIKNREGGSERALEEAFMALTEL